MHIFRKTTKFCIFGLRISNTVFEAAQCISAEKCLELHFLTVINDSTCIQYTIHCIGIVIQNPISTNMEVFQILISNSPNSTMEIPEISWKKFVLPSSGQKS